jgi:hypothetical protein
MAESYLGNLLSKATALTLANSKRLQNQAMLQPQSTRTNVVRRTQGTVESDTRFTQQAKSSVSNLYKRAQLYDPFNVGDKTQADLQKPLTYLNDILTNTKPVGYTEEYYAKSFKDLKYRQPTAAELAKQTADYKALKSKVKPGSLIRVPNTRFVVTDPTAEVNKTMLQGLVDEQTKYLGKDFANIDTKTLAAADWTSFNNLTGDVAKYNSLRNSYLAKKTKTKVDTDWIKQYDTLLADTYKAMSGEIPKILKNASSSYNTILGTKEAGLAAIQALIPTQEKNMNKPIDVSQVDPRSQIANRVKLVNQYSQTKPTPVFESRPA